MKKADIVRVARDLYARGENVTQHFKALSLGADAQVAAIELAYDLQAGTYTQGLAENDGLRLQKKQWGAFIASLLLEYGARSAVEAGVGEASTLQYVADNAPLLQYAGFDLSISRLGFAARMMKQSAAGKARLFAGDLASIPLIDDAFDAVLTNHSIESNGGKEREILTQLLRVTRRFLILVEPDFERAGAEQRTRMERLGYVRDLPGHLRELGANVLRYDAWQLNPNPLNAASLIVAEKIGGKHWNDSSDNVYASPFSGGKLVARTGCLYSEQDGMAFPVIGGFPCLLPSQAVVASNLQDNLN